MVVLMPLLLLHKKEELVFMVLACISFFQQIFMKFVYFIAREVAANESNESDEESKRSIMV